MTKFNRKISAILLTLAMVFTMMPSMALTAFATDPVSVFTVTVNGKDAESITDKWMEDNTVEAQIFPNVTKSQFKYVIAKGPSISSILNETKGINLNDIPNAMIEFKATQGEAAKNPITGKDLADAVTVTKPVDANGNAAQISDNNVFAAKLEGAANVQPILAYTQSSAYDTYGDAVDALTAGNWEVAQPKNQPYVGGNLNKDLQLKKDGVTLDNSVNFCGKFVLRDKSIININLPLPTETEKNNLTMKLGDSAKTLKSKYTATELDYLCKEVGDNAFIAWGNENPAVVDELNSEPGTNVIKPKAAGKTKITLEIYENDTAEQPAKTIAEWNVTVESNAPAVKPAPAKPTELKVKNVKKKTAKLSWKKAANAEGYEVFRSTKKKKGYKKVAAVSGNTYKNKKLKKGKTYYYKVRSFNTVNGKKVYSGYSAVKKVKIKK